MAPKRKAANPGETSAENARSDAGGQTSRMHRKRPETRGAEATVADASVASASCDWMNLPPEQVFARLIAPVTVEEFFRDYWEKKPLVVSRNNAEYYAGLFSRGHLDMALRSHSLPYVEAINVVKYVKGKRHDGNGTGRAKAADVWRKFDREGYTLQVRHPQHYSDPVYRLLYALETHFRCLVGANVYATPPEAQGLAPHWDDIEAFVLQVEGSKQWTLHAPHERLSRIYSADLDPAALGPPLAEVVLHQGDLLYFPRGLIHQARTHAGSPSFHLTVSTYQRFAWVDYLQAALPRVLEAAAAQAESLRAGLPLRFLDTPTAQYADALQALLRTVTESPGAPALWPAWQRAADEFALDFVLNRLPPPPDALPPLTEPPARVARVRLRAPQRLRLVQAGDGAAGGDVPRALLYDSSTNARHTHMRPRETEPQPLVCDGAAAVTLLQRLFGAGDAWLAADALADVARDVRDAVLMELYMAGLLECANQTP